MKLIEFGSLERLPRSIDTTARLSVAFIIAVTGTGCVTSQTKDQTKAHQAQETQIPVPFTLTTTVAGVEAVVPTVTPTTKPIDTATTTSTAIPPSPTTTETIKPTVTSAYEQVFKDNDAYSGTLIDADGKVVGGITLYFHSLKKLAAAFTLVCKDGSRYLSQFNNGGYENSSFGANQFGNRMNGSLIRGVISEKYSKLEMINNPSCAGAVLQITGQKEGVSIDGVGNSWKKTSALGQQPFSGDAKLAAMAFQIEVQVPLSFSQ